VVLCDGCGLTCAIRCSMLSARPENQQPGTASHYPETQLGPNMSRLAAKYVAIPLREIQIAGARLFEPASGEDRGRTPGVTGQFLEDADRYHERYTSHGYFRMLIEAALARRGVGPVSSVLDLGSGSGNSVVPSLSLFPEAEVVAIDISPQLLAMLRRYVDKTPREGSGS
jgi:hypothetical protein